MELTQNNWRARVWNRGSKVYKEKFRGDDVEIQPHGFIEMDFYDAVAFKGQFVPVVRNDMGAYLTEKRIEVEKIEGTNETRSLGYVNPITGNVFQSEDDAKAEMSATKDRVLEVKQDEEPAQAVPQITQALEGIASMLGKLSERMDKLESKSEEKRRPGRKVKAHDANGDHRPS